MLRGVRIIALLLWVCGGWVNLSAQDAAPPTWEVYVERGVIGNADRLIFLNALTGENTRLEVIGERYTLLGAGVLYFDYLNQRVMLAKPDGTTLPHAFIQLEDGARRVDWIVAEAGLWVAWTLTYGEPQALTTRTYIATVDGANRRAVLTDGVRAGIRALPIAFNSDYTRLYMDAQPNDLGRFSAYTQYAGLFSVALDAGTPLMLPNEPACYCGAGLQGDLFLRLTLTSDLSGFDVQVYNLRSGQHQTIPALRLNNYTQAGDLLIAPDGTQAVYALSRVENFGTPRQQVETVFMRVDLRAMVQDTLTAPLTTYVHPLRWTDNNAAVLFTSPQQSGTWKVELADGKLRKVANATWIGLLTSTR
jgi:hypothetical protein